MGALNSAHLFFNLVMKVKMISVKSLRRRFRAAKSSKVDITAPYGYSLRHDIPPALAEDMQQFAVNDLNTWNTIPDLWKRRMLGLKVTETAQGTPSSFSHNLPLHIETLSQVREIELAAYDMLVEVNEELVRQKVLTSAQVRKDKFAKNFSTAVRHTTYEEVSAFISTPADEGVFSYTEPTAPPGVSLSHAEKSDYDSNLGPLTVEVDDEEVPNHEEVHIDNNDTEFKEQYEAAAKELDVDVTALRKMFPVNPPQWMYSNFAKTFAKPSKVVTHYYAKGGVHMYITPAIIDSSDGITAVSRFYANTLSTRSPYANMVKYHVYINVMNAPQGESLHAAVLEAVAKFFTKIESINLPFATKALHELLTVKDEKSTLYTIGHSQYGGYMLESVKVPPPKFWDINLLYNDNFKEPYEKLEKAMTQERSSGIIILNGEPGCGKTNLLRQMMNTGTQRKVVYIPPDKFRYMSDPSFTAFLQKQLKNSIVILEDAETLLLDRDHPKSDMMSLSTLLNMSDGLLADELNCVYIATFNTHIDKIDAAIKRKGRLIFQYEFSKLGKEKAIKLAEALGKDPSAITTDLALTEIFNLGDKVDYSTSKKVTPKIGFNS